MLDKNRKKTEPRKCSIFSKTILILWKSTTIRHTIGDFEEL